MAWAANRQPYCRSAHRIGYVGGHVQVRQRLEGGVVPGADVLDSHSLEGGVDGDAQLFPNVIERRPLSPAHNRHPFNRSAHQRGYAGGRMWLLGTLTGGGSVTVNVAGPHHVGGSLSGTAVLDRKVLEQRPLAPAHNRQPFNRSARRSGYATLTLRIGAVLKATVVPSANAFAVHRPAARLRGGGQLSRGLEIRLPVGAQLTGAVDAITGVHAGMHPRAVLLSAANLGGDVRDGQGLASRLTGGSTMAAHVYYRGGPVVLLTGTAHVGADVWAVPRLYEVLLGYAGAHNIDELITVIDGAVPPGSVLTIDAENFNVLLDNVEVIHWHQGAWLNIGRGTVSFTLASVGSADYHWEVFYHAKYL